MTHCVEVAILSSKVQWSLSLAVVEDWISVALEGGEKERGGEGWREGGGGRGGGEGGGERGGERGRWCASIPIPTH